MRATAARIENANFILAAEEEAPSAKERTHFKTDTEISYADDDDGHDDDDDDDDVGSGLRSVPSTI